MDTRRIARGLTGRGYEVALRLGLAEYRRPFQYYDDEVWDAGYQRREHDHYEGVSDRCRYGAIASYLGVLDGRLSILDIGCGTGVLRGRIPEEKIGRYLGVDTSPAAIAQARARGFANTDFEVSGAPASGSFDTVICNEMLYLVEDPDGFLDEVQGLVRPGGLFVTSNTRFHGDFALRQKIEKRFKLIDETTIVNAAHKRKWRVGCYEKA